MTRLGIVWVLIVAIQFVAMSTVVGAEPPDDAILLGTKADTPGRIDAKAATPLLSAIEKLESSSDAKCHSTASRFEDFLFGTPLLDEARLEKVDLEKELVRRLWADSSEAATQAERIRSAAIACSSSSTR
jgi:hypothetical protein